MHFRSIVNFPFYIAKRYLIAKKSHNAINIIASISLAGIAVGTMALIVVLSVFNGFDNVVKSLINSFNPDLKIILAEGKTFAPDTAKLNRILSIQGIASMATVLEEKALLRYDERQTVAIVKGVSENYTDVSGIDSMMAAGDFQLSDQNQSYAIIGQGISIFLNVIHNRTGPECSPNSLQPRNNYRYGYRLWAECMIKRAFYSLMLFDRCKFRIQVTKL